MNNPNRQAASGKWRISNSQCRMANISSAFELRHSQFERVRSTFEIWHSKFVGFIAIVRLPPNGQPRAKPDVQISNCEFQMSNGPVWHSQFGIRNSLHPPLAKTSP